MNKHLFRDRVYNLLFKNINMYYIYAFCIFFTLTHFLSQWGFLSLSKDNSIFYQLIGFNQFGIGMNVYVIFLPFISGFISSGIWSEDKSKNLNLLITARMDWKQYINTSAISSFVIGCFTGILPILFHTWVVLMLYPINGSDIYNLFSLSCVNSYIYHSSNIKLYFIYLFIWLIYSGVYSLMGFCFSLYIHKKHVGKILPGTIHLLLWVLIGRSNFLSNFNFQNLLGGNRMGFLNNSIKISLAISLLLILINRIAIRRKINEGSIL